MEGSLDSPTLAFAVAMRLALFAALALATAVQAAPTVVDLATLKAGDRSHGFEARRSSGLAEEVHRNVDRSVVAW